MSAAASDGERGVGEDDQRRDSAGVPSRDEETRLRQQTTALVCRVFHFFFFACKT